jgi:hypothetical protein
LFELLLTGAIAAEDETRVRVIQGMERAERKRASAGWCNSVIFHLRNMCLGPKRNSNNGVFNNV